MTISYRLRLWTAGLAFGAIPMIGVAVAPTSLAQRDEPNACSWNVASMACMMSQTWPAPPRVPGT